MLGTKKLPLYRFQLDEITGSVNRVEITDYDEKCISKYCERYAFTYRLNGIRHEVQESNIDRFVNWKVHTFNPHPEHALTIIERALAEKRDKAEQDLQRWNRIIGML